MSRGLQLMPGDRLDAAFGASFRLQNRIQMKDMASAGQEVGGGGAQASGRAARQQKLETARMVIEKPLDFFQKRRHFLNFVHQNDLPALRVAQEQPHLPARSRRAERRFQPTVKIFHNHVDYTGYSSSVRDGLR